MVICFSTLRELIQMGTGFWHNLRISPCKILMIYKGYQLAGRGIGIPQHNQVININVMGGEGFKEVV